MKTEHSPCRALKIAALAVTFALTQGGVFAQTVAIPDPNLKAAIRAALEEPSGDITVADMESLTELEAGERGIRNLAGLESATNLRVLDLRVNAITNISPLADLINLTELSLWGNAITDISPLAGLTNLTWLLPGRNAITDIRPLAGLTINPAIKY